MTLEHHNGSLLAGVTGYIPESLQSKSEPKAKLTRNCALYKSAHVEWGTPPDLRESLDREFHFTLDPCAPGGVWDGREISWTNHRVFCNPPYGRGLERWLQKGREAIVAVFLLPARTDTGWFHEHALQADEIRFFRGRLKFNEGHAEPCDYSKRFKDMGGAPFPSMLVIFHTGAVAPATQEYNDGR